MPVQRKRGKSVSRRRAASTATSARRKKAVRRKAAHKSSAAQPGRRKVAAGKRPGRYWSRAVTQRSDALDLESGVFLRSPRALALSLRRSAERSKRRKSSPFRSAMSMLTFYENRAGRNLSAAQRRVLVQAKQELRKLYGRDPQPRRARSVRRSGNSGAR